MKIILAVFFWTLWIFDADAQKSATPTDTLHRAAYCLGVLTNERKRMATETIEQCSDQRRPETFSSRQECLDWSRQKMDAKISEKQKRYGRYVSMSFNNATAELRQQIVASMELGRRDNVELQTKSPPQDAHQCMQECSLPPSEEALDMIERCNLPCLERHDPTRANIVRCSFLPDQLPF